MSATPLINNKYSDIFGNYIYKYDWNKAIENKYICNFKIITSENIENSKLFDELLKNINYNEKNKIIIKKIHFLLKEITYYDNKKTILYCSNIEEANIYLNHIEWIKKMLNLELETYKIDYTTSKTERIFNIKKFRISLKTQIL